MEGAALELAKVLEEDGYESGNVFGSLFGRALLSGWACKSVSTKHATYHGFAVIGIRKTNADGLIDKENIRIGVP